MLEQARELLNRTWGNPEGCRPEDAQAAGIPEEVLSAIERSINSKTKTYRYVLPTQLLAKLVDPALDCRAVQEGAKLANSFDARSLSHRVIVPFDRENHEVLGGSSEPYVNNPLRIPSITSKFRSPQKDKSGFDDLCAVLAFAQEHPRLVGALWSFLLESIRRRLATVRIVYPAPLRVSLGAAKSILAEFTAERSGGVRLQSAALALFRSIGQRMSLYSTVSSAVVNAADASTGNAADLTCIDSRGAVALAIEVKDRQLTLRHVEDKLPGAREQGIQELLFLVRGGIQSEDADAIRESIANEFAVGQNLYVCEFDSFSEYCMVLLGEVGRREFVLAVGAALDELRAEIQHRRAWHDLLAAL